MQVFDIDRALELYNKGLSLGKVGEHFGVSQQTIKRRLQLMGITIRKQSGNQSGENNPAWKGGTSRAHINRTTKRVCIENGVPLNQCQNCGKVFPHNLNRHHKDEDRSNNKIENIEVLCVKCHNSGWFGAKHNRIRNALGRFE